VSTSPPAPFGPRPVGERLRSIRHYRALLVGIAALLFSGVGLLIALRYIYGATITTGILGHVLVFSMGVFLMAGVVFCLWLVIRELKEVQTLYLALLEESKRKV
jgi:hypothetical protein